MFDAKICSDKIVYIYGKFQDEIDDLWNQLPEETTMAEVVCSWLELEGDYFTDIDDEDFSETNDLLDFDAGEV